MSSTEPPSRNRPSNQPQDTKAARDELSSKGKVEKVREIDADEQTRKQRFLKFYKDDEAADDNMEEQNRPSPYDLYAGTPPKAAPDSSGGPFGSSRPTPDFDNAENAIVPAPAYTPPPNVSSFEGEDDGSEEQATEGALPQSDDFWNEFDFPDQTPPQANFQETPGLTRTAGFEPPPQQARGRTQQPNTAPGTVPIRAPNSKDAQTKGAKSAPGIHVPVGKEPVLKPGKEEKKQQPEPSPFGPPGKPVTKSKFEEKKSNEPVRGQPIRPKEAEQKRLPSPFEPQIKSTDKQPSPKTRPVEKKEEETYVGPAAYEPPKAEKKDVKIKTKEEGALIQEPGSMPIKPEDQERGGGGSKKEHDKDGKIVEIESPSRPAFPSAIQPMAMSATMQAAPSLHPAAVALFFQMVGTLYIMSGPQGINRTEIVLNNPSFASSKFFGSTITIEKYASAPDSFNIRLTGSHEAVVSFKENIPSLLNAFENGNFAFKVNRLDVEYSLEKPVFRRKEKGEDKGDAEGGDLGERRK